MNIFEKFDFLEFYTIFIKYMDEVVSLYLTIFRKKNKNMLDMYGAQRVSTYIY